MKLSAKAGTAYFGAIKNDAVEALATLQNRREEIFNASQAIVAKADEAGVELTEEEVAAIEANTEEMEKLDRQINARKLLTPSGTGRKTAPEARTTPPANGSTTRQPVTVRQNDPRNGWGSFGEFAMAVRGSALGKTENESVRKLQNAVTTYGNEGTGADGGFLIPPEFAREIWQKVQAEENLMTRCSQLVTGTNSMTIPKDETTPWGTSGIRVYWDGEGAAMTATKAVFEQSQFRLVKLTCLAPVSDEMLEDSTSLESWLRGKVPSLMAHKINTGIIRGTGVGMPLGILASLTAGSAISVAKETSQPADSIWAANIEKMWARMYAPWRRNAVWLINQDIEPALGQMAFAPASVTPTAASNVPLYMPPGGLSAAPYGTLKGRPVVPIQACSGIGDQGDIILADLTQYWVLTKAGGIKSDTSIHLYFDQNVTAFRFIFRINGQPVWSSAITPENSSSSLSWAVTLDAR